ncbi:cytoplasmic protein [Heyndrickxia sp. NPDC080065]|uniref:cytoplasmic protein n=1 Tax=Heyndrickxia sp. NPDC080065 TaxID=3390568 RepID=UPI003D0446E9
MERRNLNIFGSGSYAGGHYNKIKVKGEATITDDIDCHQFKIHGTSSLLGNVKAGSISIFGTVDVKENIKSDLIKIYGTLDTNGDLSINKMVIRGTGDIGGDVQGEELDVKGSISVKGDCEVETFQLDGGFQIGGLLNAGSINIGLKYGESRVKEIGGEAINIKKRSSFFGLGKHVGNLTTELIEGDHIYIEYTNAKVVRGNSVEIGPGCEIDLVEYKENYNQHKSATVKEKKK